MLFGKSKKASHKGSADGAVKSGNPAPPIVSPASELLPASDEPHSSWDTFAKPAILVREASEMVGEGGVGADGVADGQKLILGPNQSRVSKVTLDVAPGQKFEFAVQVELAASAADGETSAFFAGPLFYDSTGRVVQWWLPQTGPSVGETERRIQAIVEVPADAVSTRIGLAGSWSHDGKPSNYAVAFSGASLKAL